jgi:CelD/BcsL family acetyltransferase involved in cellulose biosynthesis
MENSISKGQLINLPNPQYNFQQLASAWQALYENAVHANVSLSPNLALPLLETLLNEHSFTLLKCQHNSTLLGLMLLERQRWRWGLLGPVLLSWSTALTFSGTPLIHNNATVADIAQLLAAADTPLLLQAVDCDSVFWRQLSQAAAVINAPIQILSTWQRAALRPTGHFQDWYDSNFDRKRRKEYRRIRNRLAETGQLVSACWSHAQPIQPWIDEFLALEARGWKGQRGTALAVEQKMASCLSQALTAFADQNNLKFWSLTLDGKIIASLFAFITNGRVSLAKIAYDESYAKYSPGVLLLLDATQNLMDGGGIVLADSCAIPDHPMINNIWRERIVLGDVLIGTPGMTTWRFKLMVKAELWRRQLRETAKTIFYYLVPARKSINSILFNML